MINDNQWDDYLRRVPRTIFGDIGRDIDKSFHEQAKNVPLRKNYKKKQSFNQAVRSKNSGKGTKTGKSFYPKVDRWINEHISLKTRRYIAVAFIITGAIVGLEFSKRLGLELWVSALIGAVAGLLALPFLIFVIKLLIFALTVAIAGTVIYLIYLVITSL